MFAKIEDFWWKRGETAFRWLLTLVVIFVVWAFLFAVVVAVGVQVGANWSWAPIFANAGLVTVAYGAGQVLIRLKKRGD